VDGSCVVCWYIPIFACAQFSGPHRGLRRPDLDGDQSAQPQHTCLLVVTASPELGAALLPACTRTDSARLEITARPSQFAARRPLSPAAIFNQWCGGESSFSANRARCSSRCDCVDPPSPFSAKRRKTSGRTPSGNPIEIASAFRRRLRLQGDRASFLPLRSP
jgi:hypothetical protein